MANPSGKTSRRWRRKVVWLLFIALFAITFAGMIFDPNGGYVPPWALWTQAPIIAAILALFAIDVVMS